MSTPPLSSSPTETASSSLTGPTTDTPPATTAPSEPSTSASTSPSPPQPARRKASYYPNVPAGGRSKPFSRSAAKRESVMMLGSIEHLQHYFTKQGLQAKHKPSKVQSSLVPAIGPALPAHLTSEPFTPSSSTSFSDLPPSPAAPPPRPELVLPDMREMHDPALLRKEVLRGLDEVERLWVLYPTPPTADIPELNERVDVLHSLLRTTHLIRSVRNYVLSLPSSSPPLPSNQPAFRPPSFTPLPRPRISSASSTTSNSSTTTVRPTSDPSHLIRHAALDVLTQLRMFEESARMAGSSSAAAGGADDGESEVSSLGWITRARSPFDISRGASPAPSHTPTHTPHHLSDHDLSDSEGDSSEERKREAWDERLVLGGGFLYRTDVRLLELGKEREAVGRYLDVVDEAVFGGASAGGGRGWRREKERRRVSGGFGERAERRHSAAPPAGRRVVSAAGGLESARFGGTVVEEPEELGALPELEESASVPVGEGEGLGQLAEVEEEEEEDEGGEEANSSVTDDYVPEWARPDHYVGDLAGRTHALLQTLLPPVLLEHLPSPPPPPIPLSDTLSAPTSLPYTAYPTILLQSLSSGQLLCIAYNAAVRSSSKPWGYISQSGIHDIFALEHAETPPPAPSTAEDPHPVPPQLTGQHTGSKGKEGGWTFRRTENLRLWAAACKLRYSIPFALPPPPTLPTSSHATTRIPGIPKGVEPVWFDPKVVATRAEGWEGMLERGLEAWVERVVEEKREEARRR